MQQRYDPFGKLSCRAGTPERPALRLNDKILPNVVQNKYSGDNNRYPCYNNPL